MPGTILNNFGTFVGGGFSLIFCRKSGKPRNIFDISRYFDVFLSIVRFFEKEGFKFIDWKNECKELFVYEDNLSKKIPNKQSIANLTKGIKIFKLLGKTDLSQSMIIQNKIVLGLEAVEGTDNLITRCKDYKKSGDRGVLVKFSKYNQSNILDIPTIGQNTIKLLKDCDYEGLYLEKDRCLIVDKPNEQTKRDMSPRNVQ